ncbi:MAG: SIR2 family protein [Bacteroidota bacterium]
MKLKEKEDLLKNAFETVQKCFQSFPVIVLGSGHSCGYKIPGMGLLSDFLIKEVEKEVLDKDKKVWETLEQKIKSTDLESSLQELQISQELSNLIIEKTWKYIYPFDRKVLTKVILNPSYLSLSKLYKHLFNSTRTRIQVITPNYDCLAEYAADAVGYAWSTGFGNGYIGNNYSNSKLQFYKNSSLLRTIDIWKVHGSLDWFASKDGSVYYLPAVTKNPKKYSNVIVTPGIEKYKRTHEEPFRSILSGADHAIESGESFICIGYGFNDEHIQPKLISKCKKEDKHIVVITKQMTKAAQTVLLKGGCKNFVVFEEYSKGTKMYSPKYLAGIEIPGINLWSLGELLAKVI